MRSIRLLNFLALKFPFAISRLMNLSSAPIKEAISEIVDAFAKTGWLKSMSSIFIVQAKSGQCQVLTHLTFGLVRGQYITSPLARLGFYQCAQESRRV